MKQVYIIDYIRTPIAKFQGGLSEVRADDLAAIVLKEIVKRNPQIPAEEIEDVILGCANQAGEDNRNVARMASLLAETSNKNWRRNCEIDYVLLEWQRLPMRTERLQLAKAIFTLQEELNR